MISDRARSLIFFVLAATAVALLAQPALARDGMNGCSIAEVETDQGRVWRYTIELAVPQGGYCRVYIGEDKDRKSWNYCWLKRASDNPVSATCDDPLDDKDFDVWKAKAVCGDQNSLAYCRRETPLVPVPR
ncbi:MAG TPA: hypothetical protein VMW68_00195 [Methyloceanibacter sp.]|nr:hypothetical protein [Methyloceanibacter sp.]